MRWGVLLAVDRRVQTQKVLEVAAVKLSEEAMPHVKVVWSVLQQVDPCAGTMQVRPVLIAVAGGVEDAVQRRWCEERECMRRVRVRWQSTVSGRRVVWADGGAAVCFDAALLLLLLSRRR